MCNKYYEGRINFIQNYLSYFFHDLWKVVLVYFYLIAQYPPFLLPHSPGFVYWKVTQYTLRTADGKHVFFEYKF